MRILYRSGAAYSHGREAERLAYSRIIGILHNKDYLFLCAWQTETGLEIYSFEQSLSAEVTPAWLARRAKVSSQRLARLIKRLYGLTPSQFITKSRVAAASRMLRDAKQSVADIAHACGFYDHSAFTRAFRSATGLTPSEFRKQS